MPDVRPLPLWAGRSMAFVGIMLVSLNVRLAAVAISPIVDQIDADIPLSSVGLGLLGAVPAVAFAVSAIFGAVAARKIGLERLTALAILGMVAGHLLRALSDSYLLLLLGTIVSLAAAGVGNVLLPPLVKRYFSDRIGLVTGLYALLIAVSASLPPAFAAPIATSASWQASMVVWAGIACLSLLPWATVLAQHRRDRAAAAASDNDEAVLPIPVAALTHSIWRSRLAWMLAVIFGLSSVHFYTSAAWFPELIRDVAGVSQLEAGRLLAALTIVGVPLGMLVPALAVRMKNISWLVLVAIAAFVLGYLGLLFAPTAAPLLWAVLVGTGNLAFPVALVLINMRSRTPQGSVALSGFVQGVGYGLAAAGPLLVGILHDLSHGWTVPMVFLIAVTLACVGAALALAKPTYIEDELTRVRG